MTIRVSRRLAAGGSALLLAFSLTACNMGGKDPASSAPPQGSTTTTSSTTSTTASTTTQPTTTTTRDGSLPEFGWVTATSMHIRSGPGIDYTVVGGTHKGEQVRILAKSGDWYQIQILTLVGYVSGAYLTFTDPRNGQPETTTTTGSTTTTTAAKTD